MRAVLTHLMFALVLTSGCAGDGSPIDTSGGAGGGGATTTLPGGGAALLATLQTDIFTPSCAISGCHDAASRAAGVDTSSTDATYNALVGVPSSCAGAVFVVPDDPDASYLLDKLGAGGTLCGSIMPLALPALSGAQLQLVRDWISQGAPPVVAGGMVWTSTTSTSVLSVSTTSTTLLD